MSKEQLSKWPWNNQPSARHVWKEVGLDALARAGSGNGYISKCLRCERTFSSRADTRAPVFCYAKPGWLAAHPEDDGKEG